MPTDHPDTPTVPALPQPDPFGGPPLPAATGVGTGRSAVRTAIVAAVVAAVVAAGVAVPVTRLLVPGAAVASAAGPTAQPVDLQSTSADAATSIADVAAAVSPSVAYVEVRGSAGQGSGSAVIIDTDGHLLTNAHVVQGAEQITVTLPDGGSYPATAVGADTTSDVAVLHVDATDLPAITVDAQVTVGETVVAIGSPFGLEGSVTAGIVSGLDRTLSGGPGQTALLGMIQTDAAINPGNSGGALVDADGDLVGINTAIYSTTGSSSGVGFAIPAATAITVADQLIATGTVTYAQLGITGSDVTAELASAYGLTVTDGALVAEVLPGSAAADADLQAGDVVVAFNGEAVASMAELTALVRARSPGEAAVITVDRDGGRLDLPVTLGTAS